MLVSHEMSILIVCLKQVTGKPQSGYPNISRSGVVAVLGVLAPKLPSKAVLPTQNKAAHSACA